MESDIVARAFEWIRRENGEGFLTNSEYCPTKDIFDARSQRFSLELERDPLFKETYSLVALVTYEIGDNAFQHNLGNWRDVPGVYFSYSIKDREVVIADRGQGILATLQKVKPDLQDDKEALFTAFNRVLSGRSPENRGRGLKDVATTVRQQGWSLRCYAGRAVVDINAQSLEKVPQMSDQLIEGVLAIVKF